jgi:hypothetical protein
MLCFSCFSFHPEPTPIGESSESCDDAYRIGAQKARSTKRPAVRPAAKKR